MNQVPDDANSIEIRFGHEELVLNHRYELISIGNDILLGLWFVVGTVFFFSESTMLIGTWLFLIGSIQMLVRPVIRLARRTHLRRIGSEQPENALSF